MKVSVIMGSSSDIEIANKCFEMLDYFGIAYEKRVISAHRALDVLKDYVDSFDEKEIELVIAMAGKAAHLPGVIAGMTSRPVIGVPIKGSAFLGMDSLLSIVQMPKGVPVATVAVDAGDNAALLAAQILAIADSDLKEKLKVYKKELEAGVLAQDEEINQR